MPSDLSLHLSPEHYNLAGFRFDFGNFGVCASCHENCLEIIFITFLPPPPKAELRAAVFLALEEQEKVEV